ncbi:MAG: Endonuclease/exonuclease/phosphatase [Betaproteobacteria bacterium]|nr:Endonuclease/exonuclease/phosphatase [Betaproteobacteria bacterium]
MVPLRISIVTYNIWLTQRWAVRAPALRGFLDRFDPDILCLQELQQQSRDFIDTALPGHKRIDDAHPGWTNEGNIYFRDSLFEHVEHGDEDAAIPDGDRRLFWTRLKIRELNRTILVGTAHLTSQRNKVECETGQSPRVEQVRRIIAALKKIQQPKEPVFFMGDMNDPVHPPRLLQDAGYVSCFAALGVQAPPTYQCYPTADVPPGNRVVNQCIDWLVANQHARAVAAAVPHFYLKDAAPSDHWPVQAVYEIAAA